MPSDEPFEFESFAATETMKAIQERIEYEVRGAWRAGYDYLHVYGPERLELSHHPIDEMRIRYYFLPTDTSQPPRPDGLRYESTYPLKHVPDSMLRNMIRRKAGIPVDMEDADAE